MGWENARFHYVITMCAAATLLCEKDAGVLKECTGVGTDGAAHVCLFWNRLAVGSMPIEIYGESWFVHFQVDIIIVLCMVDTEPLA